MRNHAIAGIETTVSVDDIVAALTLNMGCHKTEYEKAMAEYTLQLRDFFDAALESLNRGEIGRSDKFRHRLQEPENRVEDYQSMINMFSRCQEETIVLSAMQQDQIFEDNWDWAVSAKAVNNSYIGAAR